MAEQHPVRRGKRQRIARRLFPGQVLGARHQLLRLHASELRERPVMRLVTPDALGWRIHWITAVAVLIVAVILVTVDDNFVANLPALHLVTHFPDDARRV